MQRFHNLAVLITIAIIGGFAVIAVATHIVNSTSLTSSDAVPIYAGVVGFLAAIVTTIYQEISSRYKEKRERARKRWELVFPMIKGAYIPWINSARKLSDSLKHFSDTKFADSDINRILYYCCLFYGLRLQFILDHGGSIMLGTIRAETDVKKSYKDLKESFQWAGKNTRRYASILQKYFVENNSKEDIIVFETFEKELLKPQSLFAESKAILEQWLNESNTNGAETARHSIDNFISTFEDAIAEFSGREK